MNKLNGGDMKDTVYNVASTYGRVTTSIGSVFGAIISVILIIIGIKLYFTDESNFKEMSVKITKVDSNDNNSCNKTIIVDKEKSSNDEIKETERIVYNCFIHVDFNGKDVILQVNNSSINYIVGQTITVIYDSNDMNKSPVLSKLLLSHYFYWFLIAGLIICGISYLNYYLVNSSKEVAAVYGANSAINSVVSIFSSKNK